jgi:hypothetical protein
MLSSEVLESQFGPTRIGVLYQDDTDRVIKTVAYAREKILELSWVKFDPDGKDVFPDIHDAVAEGASMGKAFCDAGQTFTREVRAIGNIMLPDTYRQRFGNSLPATVAETDIFIGSEQTFYCHILETFSPDVSWPEIAGDPCPPSRARVLDFADLLDAVAPVS